MPMLVADSVRQRELNAELDVDDRSAAAPPTSSARASSCTRTPTTSRRSRPATPARASPAASSESVDDGLQRAAAAAARRDRDWRMLMARLRRIDRPGRAQGCADQSATVRGAGCEPSGGTTRTGTVDFVARRRRRALIARFRQPARRAAIGLYIHDDRQLQLAQRAIRRAGLGAAGAPPGVPSAELSGRLVRNEGNATLVCVADCRATTGPTA